MKLYLSSYRIPHPAHLEALLERPLEGSRIAVICNANDRLAPGERRKRITAFSQYLEGLGFERPALVDLYYYKTPRDLEEALSHYDIIWAMGGNVFDLRSAMVTSGFEKTLRALLKLGVVYGGDSAGAIVAGPSLKGFEQVDERQSDYANTYEGLELIHKIIVPHNDSQKVAYRGLAKVIQHANPYHELIVLNDHNAYVVDNTSSMLL